MTAALKTLKGFTDLYGQELAAFTQMETEARLTFSQFGFEEIRPPIIEATELFQRGIGEATDVVAKEMFTFLDRKGRSLSLRPEATAGVLRAAINLGLAKPDQLARLYTIGPMFRYERPQKGRQRQFHQINAECLGSASPYADAELICMLMFFLQRLDLAKLELRLNSLGCSQCRPNYLTVLSSYLQELPAEDFCEDCKRRMTANPLRVLDCKIDQDKLQEAPHFLDHICENCQQHFEQVTGLLDMADIAYQLDHHLVRGLDYYCRTTFEVVSGEIGSQTAVAGGGRYDKLISELGGGDVPGVGFACGMERLALLLKQDESRGIDFYVASLEDKAKKAAFLISRELRQAGFSGIMSWKAGSLKSQLRQAAKAGAGYCLILGPDELAANHAALKDLRGGGQTQLDLNNIASEFKAAIAARG